MKASTLSCIRLATIIVGVLAADVCYAVNPQPWIELHSPNFIVVTNANAKQARQVAYQFEMIRAVFRQYFRQSGSSSDPPVTIIAARDDATLKALLPEFWAKRGSMHPAGIYLGDSDVNYVVLQLDVSLDESGYQPYEPIYHEYVHYLMRPLIAQLPLWMVEGLAEVYGNTRIEGKKVFVGAPSPANLMVLRDTLSLPINTLFDLDASSPYYREQSKTSILYAESWALTHYLIARDWNDHTRRMQDFVDLLRKHVAQREAATRTIGDPESLQKALVNYVHRLSFTALPMDTPKIDESTFSTMTMSDAASLAVRASFMAHDRHYTEAQQMLEESLKLDPKLAAACEAMGFLALRQGNIAEAKKWTSEALALDPTRYRANYYYASTLLREGNLDEQAASNAESSLRGAIKINPGFAPAYDALAYFLAQPGHNQKLDEAYDMALWAVELEPGNVRYRIRSVEVLEKQGRAGDAIRVANLAVSLAKTPEEQGLAAATLAGAKQFQASQTKLKEPQE